MTCTFFGHKDCPAEIIPKLTDTITELITKNHVYQFYVGNNGQFDSYVINVLKKIKLLHPYISFYIVLSSMPVNHCDDETILPETVQTAPKKFAIDRRNAWMLEKSDYVITYITRSYGGAAKFAQLANKKKKKCINLA